MEEQLANSMTPAFSKLPKFHGKRKTRYDLSVVKQKWLHMSVKPSQWNQPPPTSISSLFPLCPPSSLPFSSSPSILLALSFLHGFLLIDSPSAVTPTSLYQYITILTALSVLSLTSHTHTVTRKHSSSLCPCPHWPGVWCYRYLSAHPPSLLHSLHWLLVVLWNNVKLIHTFSD